MPRAKKKIIEKKSEKEIKKELSHEVEKEEKKEQKTKKSVYTAVGRRKTAIARIRFINEKGILLVNGKPIEKYFPGAIAQTYYSEPMRTTNTLGKLSGSILVEGGGTNAQLQAIVLAISRALIKLNPDFKTTLRKRGFMTRDPRAKERKKPGLMGARKKKQSPKR